MPCASSILEVASSNLATFSFLDYYMGMFKDTSWNRQAEWYSDLLANNPDSYQEKIIKPNLLRLMAVASGENILDLACGGGFFSAAFHQAGANVIGIDLAPKLIKIAKKTNPEIAFQIGSADRLSGIADQSIDQIACVMAIQNIENIKGLLTEAKRVLRPSGKLHLVMNHPAFRAPKQSSWQWDEKNKVQFRRIDGYLSESRTLIQMHPGDKPNEKTISFHRPLQYYFKLFKNTGFAVANLEEWISDKVSEPGPRSEVENYIRQEIPLFLYIQVILK